MSISGEYITCKGKTARGKWCHRLRWRPYEGAKFRELNFTLPTKKASKRAAQDFLADLRGGKSNGTNISFKALKERWREERVNTCKKSTLAEYDRFMSVYVAPYFDDRKDAGSISPSDIQDFDQWMIGKNRPPGVRRQVLVILSTIFNYGIRKHLLTSNPTTTLDKPPAVKRDVYVLTTQQRQALIAATENRKFKILFALAMFTGLRQGELIGLRWTSVDFTRGIISVREQYSNGETSTPKGRKSRDVPFDNRTADWLRKWRAVNGGEGLVFSTASGEHLNAKNMCRREWKASLLRSGINAEIAATSLQSFRFHDMRHVYASILLSKGASLHDVQRAMGHASYKTTEENYAHLEKGYHDKLRERVGDLTEDFDLDAESVVRALNF